MNYKPLIRRARLAKKYSHSPYSKFRVGAALLAASGKIYSGCNIENSSFSLTICAERTALFKAISEGSKKFKAIAIVSDSDDYIPPCGACRQVMLDLAPDMEVILTNSKDDMKILKVRSLVPYPFTKKFLHA